MTRLFSLFIITLFISQPILALTLPKALNVPGGIVIKPLNIKGNNLPKAYFKKKQVMVVLDNKQFKAIIGLPLNTKLGKNWLRVVPHNGKAYSVSFMVKNKDYPAQYLTIKNKRKVNPTKRDYTKIAQDSKRIRKAKYTFSNTDPILPFNLPVKGPESSQFGLKRFFNKQARRPHGGLDIAVPKGTPIYAPAPGVVIETGSYFFSGNCVFLDHGKGLITLYAHLSKFSVKVGDVVNIGDKLGEVGKTGRVTGAHLHWSVAMNTTYVDPKLLLKDNYAK